MAASLAGRALRGTLLSVVARLVTRALDVVTLVILAHLLTPRDFGLVAIAATLVTVVEAVFDLPLTAILTREPELRRSHLDTSFTLSVGRGVLLAVLAGSAAIPASQLFHDARLAPIIGLLILGPIFRGGQSPRLVERYREIRFGAVSTIEVSGKLIGLGAGIAVALTYHSYWALVAISVVNPATMLAASYAFAPYKPRLSLAEWSTFSHFLKWTSASQLINAANWQCDRLILGLFVPQASLGRYTLASTISSLPDQAAIKPLGAPLLAGFAQISHDRERLARAYISASRALMLVGVPILLLLSFMAMPLTSLFLGGGKWSAAAPQIEALSLAALLAFPCAPLPALAMATGETKTFASRSFLEFAIQIPLVLVLTYILGVEGAIASRFIVGLYMLVISGFLVKRISGTLIVRQLGAIKEPLVGGIAMYAWLYAVHYAHPWLSHSPALLVQASFDAVSGVVVYIIAYGAAWSAFGRPEGVELKVIRFAREILTRASIFKSRSRV